MKKYFPYPFVRLIIPLAAGIYTGSVIPAPPNLLLLLIVVLWLVMMIILSVPRMNLYFNLPFMYMIHFIVLIFFLGIYLFRENEQMQYQHIDRAKKSGEKYYLLKVSEDPVVREHWVRFTAGVFELMVEHKTLSREFRGRGIFYFHKDSLSEKIQYGQPLIVKSRLSETKNDGNPSSFDYRRYLLRKGILWRQYLNHNHWWFAGDPDLKSHRNIFHACRNYMIKKLQHSGLREQEMAVAVAMLMGTDEGIDDSLRKAYADSGAMHILCVSGLHVGIIYLLLNMLLSIFKKINNGKQIQMVLIIIFVWIYAGVAGFNAPVLRASLMFSFVALGKIFNRQAYVYNSLAASAFLIMIFNPSALFTAGFQLSYAAVFFIVWLYKPLYLLLTVNNIIISRAWSVVAVSIAASIGTLPLVLHYFHQFPLYFILTNLVVVPLAFIIVMTGMLLMLIPALQPVMIILRLILKQALLVLNKAVYLIQNLPDAGTDNLYLSGTQSLMLYMLIIAVAFVLVEKKYEMLKTSLLIFFLLLISFSQENIKKLKQNRIIVYNIPGGTAIDLVYGKNHYFLSDSVIYNNQVNMKNIRENWIKNSLNPASFYGLTNNLNIDNDFLFFKNNIILFNGFSILLLDGNPGAGNLQNVYFDAVLIRKGFPEDAIDKLKTGIFILDSSVPAYLCKKLQKQAKTSGINLYMINSSGAYIRDFND